MRQSSDSESNRTITGPENPDTVMLKNKHADSSTPEKEPIKPSPNADPEKDAPAQSQMKNPQITEYTTALDWEGPDDPQNPRNWSFRVKVWHTCVSGMQCFTLTFGTAVYTSGFESVMSEFNVSSSVAVLPFTLYVIALGFGPLFSAPISETYGRRFVYMYIFPIAMLFIVGAGAAQNIQTLIICRFFAAAFGAGPLAVGAGTLLDMFSPLDFATASTLFTMMPFLGPTLGPVVGGYVSMAKGWRWTQWLVLMVGAVSYLITLPSHETYKKIILKNRAKKYNLPPPADPLPKGWAFIKAMAFITLLRPIRMLFTEAMVASLGIYAAFNFGVLYGFFSAFPAIFESPYPDLQVYHFNLGESGLVFLSLAIGIVAAVVIFIWIDRVVYRPQLVVRQKQGNNAPLPPEERLYGAMVGCFLLPIGLFWFAWTARSSIHWIVPILACIPFACGNLLVFMGSILFLIEAYGPLVGASAVAATGIFRYIVGAVFPLFTSQMYRAMGVGWATSLFGFVTLALLPIPWVFRKYGPRIRKSSAYNAQKPAAPVAPTPAAPTPAAAKPAAPSTPTSIPKPSTELTSSTPISSTPPKLPAIPAIGNAPLTLPPTPAEVEK